MFFTGMYYSSIAVPRALGLETPSGPTRTPVSSPWSREGGTPREISCYRVPKPFRRRRLRYCRSFRRKNEKGAWNWGHEAGSLGLGPPATRRVHRRHLEANTRESLACSLVRQPPTPQVQGRPPIIHAGKSEINVKLSLSSQSAEGCALNVPHGAITVNKFHLARHLEEICI